MPHSQGPGALVVNAKLHYMEVLREEEPPIFARPGADVPTKVDRSCLLVWSTATRGNGLSLGDLTTKKSVRSNTTLSALVGKCHEEKTFPLLILASCAPPLQKLKHPTAASAHLTSRTAPHHSWIRQASTTGNEVLPGLKQYAKGLTHSYGSTLNEFSYSLAGMLYPPADVCPMSELRVAYEHLQQQDVMQLNLDRGPDDPVGH